MEEATQVEKPWKCLDEECKFWAFANCNTWLRTFERNIVRLFPYKLWIENQ
jgi:hypothetical protein